MEVIGHALFLAIMFVLTGYALLASANGVFLSKTRDMKVICLITCVMCGSALFGLLLAVSNVILK